MSDLNEFLGYDPDAVDNLKETMESQPLNRNIGIRASQKAHKPKREIRDTSTTVKAEDALESIREMLGDSKNGK